MVILRVEFVDFLLQRAEMDYMDGEGIKTQFHGLQGKTASLEFYAMGVPGLSMDEQLLWPGYIYQI